MMAEVVFIQNRAQGQGVNREENRAKHTTLRDTTAKRTLAGIHSFDANTLCMNGEIGPDPMQRHICHSEIHFGNCASEEIRLEFWIKKLVQDAYKHADVMAVARGGLEPPCLGWEVHPGRKNRLRTFGARMKRSALSESKPDLSQYLPTALDVEHCRLPRVLADDVLYSTGFNQ